MKIGVIGGGSIGLLISRYFAKHHEVTIYVRRDEQKRQLNKYGLQLSNSSVSYPIRSLLINEIKDEDCFVFCVKQHHLEEVIATVQKVDSQSPFIFLQNGMGHIKLFEHIEQPIYVGVIEHGAYRKSDHLVTHTGKGVIKLASYDGDVSQLYDQVKQLTLADFPIEVHPDWQLLLSEKLVINAVINPLTALFGVPNRAIIMNESIYELAEKLCIETTRLLNLSFSEQWARVQRIAEATGENNSSMLTDINHQQQTENEAISGYLLTLEKDDTPYTRFVYHSIKALETKNHSC
ncbi:MAG TPA: 2-dehydropantoate 2-reductase [Virgibacillus sp.]|nr:2-dehydropantoate 2-reductase [Virgibacillus sp.]